VCVLLTVGCLLALLFVLPQLALGGLALVLAWLVARTVTKKGKTGAARRWVLTLCAVGGLLAAAAAWAFVPNRWGQWSVWGGYRACSSQVTFINGLAADDIAGFAADQSIRHALAVQFPRLRPSLSDAEHAWFNRSAKELWRELDAVPAEDAPGLAVNHRRQKLLRAVAAGSIDGVFPQYAADLFNETEASWATRATDMLVKVDPFLSNDPLKMSQSLRELVDDLNECRCDKKSALLQRLTAPREQAVRASLDAARRDVVELIRQDRYQAAKSLADRLNEQLVAEATAAKLDDDLIQFCQSCGFLAELQERAGSRDP
jgi:hypothetical protein